MVVLRVVDEGQFQGLILDSSQDCAGRIALQEGGEIGRSNDSQS